jgi:hypothetical protein
LFALYSTFISIQRHATLNVSVNVNVIVPNSRSVNFLFYSHSLFVPTQPGGGGWCCMYWNINTAGGPVESERVTQREVEDTSNVTNKWRNRSSE